MKKVILMSLVAAPFIIVGCGGGGSTTTTNAKITGTVPGTLIEAFCDNNYYAQVSSTNNGTNKHPFEIQVPTNTNCKLIMTTNENDPENRVITEIGFSNGSTIIASKDIDLGNIPLEMTYRNADDRDGDHVVDAPLQVNENGATSNNTPVHDADGNGVVDAYDDADHNGIPNAYEDDDKDGIINLHDDSNGNGKPDYIDDNNQGSGNDNNQGSGNDNNQGNGNDNNQGSGNDNNQGSGNDNHQGSGNDNNQDSGNDNNQGNGNDNNQG